MEPPAPPSIIVRPVAPPAPKPPWAPTHLPSEAEARTWLAQAQAEWRQTDRAAQEAAKLVARAPYRCDHTELALAQYADLDNRVIAFDMKELRRERAMPADTETRLELESAMSDRRVARDTLDRAGAAHRQAGREAQAAQKRAAEQRGVLDHAVASVLIALGRQLVADLDRLEGEALDLRQKIAALQLPISTPLPGDITSRPHRQPKPLQRDPMLTGAWNTLRGRLYQDAHAKLNGPEG